MADQTKGTSRSIYMDSTAAISSMQRLVAEGDKLKQKIDAGEAAGKAMNKELAKFDQVSAKIKAVQQQLDAGLKPTLQQQTNLVRQLNNELSRMSENDPAFKVKLENYGKQNALLNTMRTNIANVTKEHEKLNETGSKFGQIFTHVFEAFASYAIIEKAAEAIKELFVGSIEEADQAAEATDGLRVALTNVGRLDVFERLIGKAQEFADKYRRLDNDDVTKVFTKLVDYGKLTEKQMVEVTDVIINFAAKQKVSLEEATDTITKGLEGSGKALKTYGINMKDATSFTERYSLIVNTLGDKIKGAEAAFEQTNQGLRQGFQQRIRDIKEDIGNFIYSLTGLEKTLFDNAAAAKKDADEATILVKRYEELSKQTNLTTADKKELQNITTTLAAKFGDSVIEVDKETGALKLNIAATKDLITQKLLLANGKAVEIIGKLNKAQLDEANSTDILAKNTLIYNEALKKLGTTKEKQDKKEFAGGIASEFSKDIRTPGEKALDKIVDVINKSGGAAAKAKNNVKEYAQQLEELGFTLEQANKLLNPKVGGTIGIKPDGKSAEELAAEKKSEEQLKKLEEQHKKYLDLLKDLDLRMDETGTKLDAKISKINYDLGKDIEKAYETAQNPDELQRAIEKAQTTATLLIHKAASEIRHSLSKEPISIRTNFDQKKLEDEIDKGLTKTVESLSKKPGVFDRLMGIFTRDKKATSELAVITAAPNSKEKLDAQLKQLKEEEAQAIEMSDKTDAQIALIHAQYAQKSDELIKNHQIAQIDEIINYAQQATNILKEIDQAQTNKENAALQKQISINDKKRKDIEKLSKSKVLTEVEAQRQLAELDAEDSKRKDELQKKQFERGKKLSIAQALINGAMAITSILAAIPGPLDLLTLKTGQIIAIASAIATTAAQVTVIGSQKYEKGGIANGASHSEGGIKLVDSKSRRIVGEMEGDEPYMILSKNFRRNNPDFIAAALDSSMNRNGARIRPFWESRPYSRLDYGGIIKNQAIVRKFESGGIFNSHTGNSNNLVDDTVIRNMIALLSDNHDSLEKLRQSTDFLNSQLSRGISSNISLKQLDDAYRQRARIIADAAP